MTAYSLSVLPSTVAHNCHGKTKSHGTTKLTHGKTVLSDGKTKLIHSQYTINSQQNKINSRQNKVYSRQNKENVLVSGCYCCYLHFKWYVV